MTLKVTISMISVDVIDVYLSSLEDGFKSKILTSLKTLENFKLNCPNKIRNIVRSTKGAMWPFSR